MIIAYCLALKILCSCRLVDTQYIPSFRLLCQDSLQLGVMIKRHFFIIDLLVAPLAISGIIEEDV